MIQISNTLRRNTLTPALSALLAAGLLGSASIAQAAKKPDQRILDAVAAANTADIEAISRIGRDTADQIGTAAIPMKGINIKTLSVGLADAIQAKTSANPPDPTDRNRLDNKQDEIGEVAAFIQEGIANNPSYQSAKKAVKATSTLLKGVFSTAKKATTFVGTTFFNDVAAGVGLTIHNDVSIPDTLEAKLLKKLTKAKLEKKFGGKSNVAAIDAGLRRGFSGDAATNLNAEDGNIDTLAEIDDAETDFRNGA